MGFSLPDQEVVPVTLGTGFVRVNAQRTPEDEFLVRFPDEQT